MDPYTVAITSCNRFGLLARTLDTLLPRLEQPIEKIIIIEDSANYGIIEVVRRYSRKLNEKGYLPLGRFTKGIEVIVNDPPIGQILSIDRVYSHIETDWIFHCEDDWEFCGEGFIGHSFALLNEYANYSMVGLRAEADFRKPFQPGPVECNGVCFRKPDKSHPAISFNPGLRRMRDYRIVGSYADLALRSRESIVAKAYESLGYSMIYLGNPATQHIGADAHVSDNVRPKKMLPKLKQSYQKRMEVVFRKYDPSYNPHLSMHRRHEHIHADVRVVK